MKNKKKMLAGSGLLVAGLLLAGCGGGGGGTRPPSQDVCTPVAGEVNWSALATKDCNKLSAYNLFQEAGNPTANARGGIAYDLNTPLFSDYSSKYRFLFLPAGQKAQYSEHEAFDFPEGTVITKTFALPADTAERGFAHENLIETRLLIRRASGWVALPYVWNAAKTEATLQRTGAQIAVTLVHEGSTRNFTYSVPDTNQCVLCHQWKPNGAASATITPIGPKARLLNHDISVAGVTQNQLVYWRDNNMLSNLPADVTTVEKVPSYTDADKGLLPGMDLATLQATAKGYLDVNCAHCHRPEGYASNTGLDLEYWRDFAGNPTNHGVCKRPVAYGGGSLSYDLVPGNAAASILHARMNTARAGDKMPEIGRGTVHDEGVALIAAWINALPANSCNGS